jgi:GntR family transcriptional regulator
MFEKHQLNKSVPVPLYYQLKNMLLEEFKSGQHPVDSMIPTEKEFSELFAISRTTVRQALTELVREGWLYRVKSKGTFIAQTKIKQDFIKRLETFNEQIIRSGCVPSTQLLQMDERLMPENVYSRMNLPQDTKAVYLYRRRCADGDPIVTVETYLPYSSCAFVLDQDMSKVSLYNVLATRENTRICRVTRVLEAVPANSRDVATLNIMRGKPIQFFTTIGFNHADEPIEYSLARYRGDRNKFEVDILIDTTIKG